jgi:hypothetical protein
MPLTTLTDHQVTMLETVYTGQQLLQSRQERLSRDSRDWVLADGSSLFHTHVFQDVAIVDRENDTVAAELIFNIPPAAEQILVGLLDCSLLPQTDPSPGVCVTIDLRMGAVLDALNESGVVGYVDEAKLSPGCDVSFRFELHMRGGNCIPSIFIAGERLLLPAVRLAAISSVQLLAGAAMWDQRNAPEPTRGVSGETDSVALNH